MKRTIAGCAMAVFAIVALATAPLATASPDDDFLKALADGGISVPASMSSEVIGGARQLCKGWSSGASSSDQVSMVAKATGLGNSQASMVVRAATNAYCPKYLSKI
jgi:hypothetical protein